MYQEKKEYGLGLINSYLPTPRAVRYLNWFRAVVWHKCGKAYHRHYPEGDNGVLGLFTIAGEGVLRPDGCCYRLEPGSVALVPHLTPMEIRDRRDRRMGVLLDQYAGAQCCARSGTNEPGRGSGVPTSLYARLCPAPAGAYFHG